MSYAIVRNEKLTRNEAKGRCVHNDRRAKNHSNKEIDEERTALNYYLKKNSQNYVKEFDKLKQKKDLKGQIRENSIIMCEMLFTSDAKFFEEIGEEETKRYFEESYKFVCNYKQIGEENIISAVVHLDEGVPHMHLVYVPVIHTKNKDGNKIDKVCCRDFWKGRDSYRNLQNAYFEYVTSKGFVLERGIPSEETGIKHQKIEDLKKITNFQNTKKVLENTTLEAPQTPDINGIKLIMLNKAKIENEIIKPKDEKIKELYEENLRLHEELSKQANIVETAIEYEKKFAKTVEENVNLKLVCRGLTKSLEDKQSKFQKQYENKAIDLENEYKSQINNLQAEVSRLKKKIKKFKETLIEFIKWICNKFSYSSENEIIREFEEETYNSFEMDEKAVIDEFEKEDDYFDINW